MRDKLIKIWYRLRCSFGLSALEYDGFVYICKSCNEQCWKK